jgi:hypothetical protein
LNNQIISYITSGRETCIKQANVESAYGIGKVLGNQTN